MKIGIGIDTGGTYTDAVVYDFENKAVLGTAKSLTTKENLSTGILKALDSLPGDYFHKAEIVSLSTTLATNACVEDQGGRAKLIFFGGDPKIVAELGESYGLPPVGEIHIQEGYTRFSGEIEQEPDWDYFRDSIRESFSGLDGAGIIELNAMKNGAVVEKKARELFRQEYDIPVICGHELFSELSGLQRGSSTLLNAKLFPVICQFLDAVMASMTEREIHAEVVIVRSDGSMMSEEFARLRPVETLLCGPAASVMGGTWLTGEQNSVIVDMGGTTTDIAIVKDGLPIKVVNGVGVGKWKTFVDGIYLKTFGLGGDSAIHYDNKKLFLEEYRVVPLCVAADQYPVILQNLEELIQTVEKHTRFLHEHYLLNRDISGDSRYTAEEQAFCAALKDGPLMLRAAAEAVGKDIYTLDVSRLLKEGVVQMCGLTPTDIMHIKGDFNRYATEASMLGVRFAASNLGILPEEFCDWVYDEVKRKIYQHVVKALLENQHEDYLKNGVGKDVEGFIDESYRIACECSCVACGSYRNAGGKAGQNLISAAFRTGFSLVGIGAPIHIFLRDVAEMLGTKAVIPEHFEVANALGALVGNVCATHTIEIRPISISDGGGYSVFGNNETKSFEELEDAQQFAAREALEGARRKAVEHGAQGELSVTLSTDENQAEARDCTIYLGTQVTACAVGSIGF